MFRKNKITANCKDYFRDAVWVAYKQRDKEGSLQLYFYHANWLSKLQFVILLEESKKLPSSSDDEDLNAAHFYPPGIHHLTTFFLIM